MTTYALIAAIESDAINLNNKTNTTTIPRMYEKEAIACFTAWRQNGGWLKDIPIHVHCPTVNKISNETRLELEKLGVAYTEQHHPITDTFTSGFLNIPFVGMLYEQALDVDYLIKIDLDMNLLQPLPRELVECGDVVCGQYDDFCTKAYHRTLDGWANPFDTGFMISPTTVKIYEQWFGIVQRILTSPNSDPQWEQVRARTGEYYLEEYAMDYIFHNNLSPIRPIQRYQLGEWYTPVSMFTDDELSRVYFWHEHLIPDPKYDKIRQRVEFFNRMRRLTA